MKDTLKMPNVANVAIPLRYVALHNVGTDSKVTAGSPYSIEGCGKMFLQRYD